MIPDTLAGRTALVTGAGRGIGRATALGLARCGASIVLMARSADELDETARQISDVAGVSLPLQVDLSRPNELNAAVRTAQQEVGAIDILINNAATVAPIEPSVSLDPDEWAAAIELNLIAVARLSFAVLPAMLTRRWGRIVNISSGIAAHPAGMLRANAYATSKAGLEAHTKNLAAELSGTGVTVNGYRPGGVDTAMQAWIRSQPADEIGPALHERFRESHESGSLITPEHSARSLIARLTGEDNGQIWSVDDTRNRHEATA